MSPLGGGIFVSDEDIPPPYQDRVAKVLADIADALLGQPDLPDYALLRRLEDACKPPTPESKDRPSALLSSETINDALSLSYDKKVREMLSKEMDNYRALKKEELAKEERRRLKADRMRKMYDLPTYKEGEIVTTNSTNYIAGDGTVNPSLYNYNYSWMNFGKNESK